MKPNLAFCGYIGSGKSTAAEYLVKSYGYKRVAFADALKVRVYDYLLGVSNYWSEEDSKIRVFLYKHSITEEDLPSPPELEEDEEKIEWVNANKKWLRKSLQLLGTEFYRSKDPDHWITKLSEKLNKQPYMEEYPPLVLDDLRFRNEAEWLQSRGFKIIWVVREGLSQVNHPSEALSWIPDIKPTMIYNPEDKVEMFYTDIQRIIYAN